jgi:phage shock protein C
MDTHRKLTRSTTNSVLGGVCGGLAEYVDVDPTLVRVGYVALALLSAGFPGLLLYIVLWVLMPVR